MRGKRRRRGGNYKWSKEVKKARRMQECRAGTRMTQQGIVTNSLSINLIITQSCYVTNACI